VQALFAGKLTNKQQVTPSSKTTGPNETQQSSERHYHKVINQPKNNTTAPESDAKSTKDRGNSYRFSPEICIANKDLFPYV
jgi:hypothetical protein